MKTFHYLLAVCAILFAGAAVAQDVQPQPTEMSCSDYKFTPEAAVRFANFKGACESIVSINGHDYGKFSAIVRKASSKGVTLTLKKTDHTFTVSPGPDLRVLIGSEKVKPQNLGRGQEITIYLSVDQFAQPAITELDLVSADSGPVAVPAEPVESLPTTASWLPTFVLAGLIAVMIGALMQTFARRMRA